MAEGFEKSLYGDFRASSRSLEELEKKILWPKILIYFCFFWCASIYCLSETKRWNFPQEVCRNRFGLFCKTENSRFHEKKCQKSSSESSTWIRSNIYSKVLRHVNTLQHSCQGNFFTHRSACDSDIPIKASNVGITEGHEALQFCSETNIQVWWTSKKLPAMINCSKRHLALRWLLQNFWFGEVSLLGMFLSY